jgi:outer membrane protein TolC
MIAGNRLPFSTCLEHALEHNLKAEVATLGARAAALDVNVARAAFDPTISAAAVTYPAGDGTNATDTNVVVEKRFITGTEIEVEGGTAFFDRSDGSDGYAPDKPQGSITLRQPLLRGAGIAVNRAGIDLAKVNTRSADASARAEVMEVLRATTSAYWTAAWAQEALKVQQDVLARSERVLQEVNDRQALGAATKIDRLEAESAVADAREQVERARQRAQDALGTLSYLLGLMPGHEPAGLVFEPFLLPPDPVPDPEECYRQALRTNPLEVLLANEVERRMIQQRVARNALLPAVDVELRAATSGLYGYGFSSFASSGGDDNDNWSALLRVSVPWTFRAERAQAEQTRLELIRSERAREDGRRQLRMDIFQTCREIESGRRQLEAAAQAVAVNRAKWDEQYVRQKEGLVAVRDLREAEGEYQAARLRELSARLTVLMARARLARLDGTILEVNGMTF